MINLDNIYPVILAGGLGKRLWPLSKTDNPKQFVSIFESESLFQKTLLRLDKSGFAKPSVVCDEKNLFLAKKQAASLSIDCDFIAEPEGRNTASALALFALITEDKDKTLFILPADHAIKFNDEFLLNIERAEKLVSQGRIALFGIKTSEPSSAYGYIKKGQADGEAFKIDSFHEKPKKDLATTFHKSPDFFWNSGMLLTNSKTYLEELEKYEEAIYTSVFNSIIDSQTFDKEQYIKTDSLSIDVAVLEKTSLSYLLPLEIDWDDLGSWNSISKNTKKDSAGNSLIGNVLVSDTKNSYVRSDTRSIAAIGLQDMILVDTEDALLISTKKDISQLSHLIKKIEEDNPETFNSSTVMKPWGRFTSLLKAPGFQIKVLEIESGHQLSLQKHKHRSEHWTVVEGIAEIIKGSENFILNVNESIYFDKEEVHSVKNSASKLLKIVEVQIGDYLGEDDIERLDDIYDRPT